MSMHEQSMPEPFYRGEKRKIYFTLKHHDECECNIDEEFQDFVLKNPIAYLLKNGERIEISKQELDPTEKMLIVYIDCANLEGLYKLVVEYELNDELKVDSCDLRVRKI